MKADFQSSSYLRYYTDIHFAMRTIKEIVKCFVHQRGHICECHCFCSYGGKARHVDPGQCLTRLINNTTAAGRRKEKEKEKGEREKGIGPAIWVLPSCRYPLPASRWMQLLSQIVCTTLSTSLTRVFLAPLPTFLFSCSSCTNSSLSLPCPLRSNTF